MLYPLSPRELTSASLQVEAEKAVVIQGPHGSEKTALAKGIADYFKVCAGSHVLVPMSLDVNVYM